MKDRYNVMIENMNKKHGDDIQKIKKYNSTIVKELKNEVQHIRYELSS